jgi:hypothetical protein
MDREAYGDVKNDKFEPIIRLCTEKSLYLQDNEQYSIASSMCLFRPLCCEGDCDSFPDCT